MFELRELATIRRLHQALEQLKELGKEEQERLDRLTMVEVESKLQALDEAGLEELTVDNAVDETALLAFVRATRN